MPEGDAVLRTARRLNQALAGKPLTRTDIRVPRFATTDLRGRVTTAVISYGKHLFHHLAGDVTIHSHLKMDGSWLTLAAPHSAPPSEQQALRRRIAHAERAAGTRALLYTPDAMAFGTDLGLVEVITTREEADVVARLGPDILAPEWADDGRTTAMGNLKARPDRLLGEALLDQTVVAGLGTMWISEMCFRHQVLPWSAVGRIAEGTLAAVLDDARRFMLDAAAPGNPRKGMDGKVVHARSGLPCVRCGDTVRVATAGPRGRERTLFSCPTCQGGYAPTDDRRPQRPLGDRAHQGRRRPR